MKQSRARLAVFEALKVAAPGKFNDAMRRSFLSNGSNLVLAELDMDSLGKMEFCIAVEVSTGVTLLPPQLAELATTDSIERWIGEKLGESDRTLPSRAEFKLGQARVPRPALRTARQLDRAYRLFRRRVGRCRTENELNRIHIAIENYMTPAETRYFAAALAADPADSASRQWIAKLVNPMPINKVRPVEYVRRGIIKSMTRYTADTGSTEQKTLIIGFAGRFNRLMSPMPWLLDCLNPALYDVIVLRDFSRLSFVRGIPGLGGDFFELVSSLKRHVDPRAYRNAIALGTSGGGFPAVLAAILLRLDRGIFVCGQDYPRVAAKLKSCGLDEEPYAALLASRPRPFPELVLAYGAGYRDDAESAIALHERVPSRLVPVKNCATHSVLAWHVERGTLPAFLATILGQSLGNDDSAATLGRPLIPSVEPGP